MDKARYDGIAAWYDDWRPALTPDERAALMRLLGTGDGRCLDVGCGTGVATTAVAERGWWVVGVDVSAEQLDVARRRGLEVVEGSAHELPFEDESFDAAVSVLTHTDVGDFRATVAEIARVLRPGAPFVYIGVHPCFVGPHSVFVHAEGMPALPSRLPAEPALRRDAPGRLRPGGPAGARRRAAPDAGGFHHRLRRRGLADRALRGAEGARLPVPVALRARR